MSEPRMRKRSARWRDCWTSCAACGIRRAAVPGIASRTSRASRRTPSKKPTKWPMPSRATSPRDIEAELGDLLFQVVFHAQMGAERQLVRFRERGRFHCRQAHRAASACVRRCAHRLGGRAEPRLGRTQGARTRGARARQAASELADVPLALPALARAAKLGKRAGRVGFDWPDAQGVRAKIEEELREIDEVAAGRRTARGGRRARRPVVRGRRTGRDISAWIRKRRCASPMPSSNAGFAPWKRWRAKRALVLETLDAGSLGRAVERGQEARKKPANPGVQ